MSFAPDNIHENHQQQQIGYAFTTQGRPDPPPINNNHYEKSRSIPPNTVMNNSFCGVVPRFEPKDAIQWYQYLQRGHYSTYSAEYCWDMEGQWLSFKQNYARNPSEAEANMSLFSLNDNEQIVIDILNMKVKDTEIGMEYELKRTNTLTGVLNDYGHIAFNGDQWQGTFMYDRESGYHKGITENTLNIGDKVVFEAFWNLDGNNEFIYNLSQKVNPSQSNNLALKMLAFNVRGVNNQEEDTKEVLISLDVDALSYCDEPLIAPDFASQRFEGLIVSLKGDGGFIVCYPYTNQSQSPLTLLYHNRFMKRGMNDVDINNLCANTCVQCSIGVNPLTYGQGIFGFVAMDVVISKYNAFDSEMKLLPITLPLISRKYRGSVSAVPDEDKKWGFIYNCFENNMCTLQYDHNRDYRLGMDVRYNERKNEIGLGRNAFIAMDVVAVERIEEKIVNTYYTANNAFISYGAKQYILDCRLNREEHANIAFKYIESTQNDTDIHVLVCESEKYLNAFLNDCGGVVLFGVEDNGCIKGLKCMNAAKRSYIKKAIIKRLRHFTPAVTSEYVSVECKQVIDCDGYALIDTYIIIVDIAMVYDSVHNIHFETSMNKVYEMKHRKLILISTSKHPPNKDPSSKLSPKFVFDCMNVHIFSNKEDDNAAPISTHPICDNKCDEDTLQYTTPELNALTLPSNTERGRVELASRVQRKLNEMMKISEYMLDPRWQSILTMASSDLYNAQKTTWQLMKNLETEKIRDKARKKQRMVQLSQFNQAHAMFGAHHHPNNNVSHPVSFHDVDGVIPVIPHDDGLMKSPSLMEQHTPYDMESDHIDIGQHTDCDSHGLPILPDKSKYKAVALEYCQKMGWVKPTESIANDLNGYRATVSFGKVGHEKSASGIGLRQKNAIYEAYQQLVPLVIPSRVAKDLMMKWVPGYKKKETVMAAIIADTGQSVMKHPKSVLLEWAQKHGMAPPKTTFSEFSDSARNMRIWTARVTFGGKTIEARASKKKDAESRCCQELLTFVMKRDIGSHEQL